MRTTGRACCTPLPMHSPSTAIEGASSARNRRQQPASRSSSLRTTSARKRSCGSLRSTSCSSGISKPGKGLGFTQLRQSGRAVPQPSAVAADGHAAAAAATQDLDPGVPRRQSALSQRHPAEDRAACSRRSSLPYFRGSRAARHRRAVHGRGNRHVVVGWSCRTTSCIRTTSSSRSVCLPARRSPSRAQVDLHFRDPDAEARRGNRERLPIPSRRT